MSSELFKVARVVDDVEAVGVGDPKRMARRAKNVAVGRAVGKAGAWRTLWR